MLGPSGPLGLLFGLGLVLAVCGLAVLRTVPPGRRLVVFRGARVVAVRGPGVAVLLPLLHRGVWVPAAATLLELPVPEARTADEVPVTAYAQVLAEVLDPAAWAEPPGGWTRATDAVETALREELAATELTEVPRLDRRALAERITERTSAWGVAVTEVQLARVDVRLGAELLRWARPPVPNPLADRVAALERRLAALTGGAP